MYFCSCEVNLNGRKKLFRSFFPRPPVENEFSFFCEHQQWETKNFTANKFKYLLCIYKQSFSSKASIFKVLEKISEKKVTWVGFEPSVKNDFSRIFAIGLEKKDYCFGLPMNKAFHHKNIGGAIEPFVKTIDNGHVFCLVLNREKL